MKNLPTQERAIRKRAALLGAATREFACVGFEVATAKSIAAQASVATGTFYQYFENKNDILRVLASERFSELHKQVEALEAMGPSRVDAQSVSQLFETVMTFVYDFHSQGPELHQVLEQRRALDKKLAEIMSVGEEVLRSRVLLFVRAFNVPAPEIVADNLFAMAEGVVHRMVFEHRQEGDPVPTEADIKKTLKVGADMLAAYFEQMPERCE